MARPARSTRLTRCATAATTLAAVLSVVGAAAAATGPAHHEVRSGLSDAQVVRVFAKVVEAMARDLLKPGHTHAALAERPAALTEDDHFEPWRSEGRDAREHVAPLPPRLLDLPPPTC